MGLDLLLSTPLSLSLSPVPSLKFSTESKVESADLLDECREEITLTKKAQSWDRSTRVAAAPGGAAAAAAEVSSDEEQAQGQLLNAELEFEWCVGEVASRGGPV